MKFLAVIIGVLLISSYLSAQNSSISLTVDNSSYPGHQMPISACSDAGGLRITIEDASGTMIYDSDLDWSAEDSEEEEPWGVMHYLDVIFDVPNDAVFPLTVMAEDGLARTVSKEVTRG